MIIQKFLTNTNFKKGILKRNKWISIHYTANNGDTAWGNCNYFHEVYRGASANYFVDEKSIYQCVEDKDVAWAVGADKYYNGCRNTNSISIELCSRNTKSDKSGEYYFLPETVENAKELVKYLMKKYRNSASTTSAVTMMFHISGAQKTGLFMKMNGYNLRKKLRLN